ncbi:MAG: DUF6159 family protein [Acidimicrobiales bacterium]
MSRIANSWALARSSWSVLRDDKELALIPVISFVCTVVVITAVGGTVWFTLNPTQRAGETTITPTPLTYVVGAAGYLLTTFVVTYFAAALVAGAHQRLTGGNPTLGSAFRKARSRLAPLLLWSLLTGTVGLILQAIRDRAGFLGQISVNLVGMAWEIVTWLAVPVVVVEGTGPIESLKRAAVLFKQTWGENLIAQGGFGILGLLAVLPALLIIFVVVPAVPLAGIVLAAAWIAATSVVLSALNGIYRAALYLYASTRQAPASFSVEEMQAAFRSKAGHS